MDWDPELNDEDEPNSVIHRPQMRLPCCDGPYLFELQARTS